MKKSWKIIGIVILTVFILGLICIGVGVLTGADYSRIFSVIDDKFQIESTLSLYSQYFDQLKGLILEMFA
ncbi:MAG: hypothetical protein Q4F31_05540 [Eubacteriales bacterium]|nr:hypothetical protein [Eubacteriales bacterium]